MVQGNGYSKASPKRKVAKSTMALIEDINKTSIFGHCDEKLFELDEIQQFEKESEAEICIKKHEPLNTLLRNKNDKEEDDLPKLSSDKLASSNLGKNCTTNTICLGSKEHHQPRQQYFGRGKKMQVHAELWEKTLNKQSVHGRGRGRLTQREKKMLDEPKNRIVQVNQNLANTSIYSTTIGKYYYNKNFIKQFAEAECESNDSKVCSDSHASYFVEQFNDTESSPSPPNSTQLSCHGGLKTLDIANKLATPEALSVTIQSPDEGQYLIKEKFLNPRKKRLAACFDNMSLEGWNLPNREKD